MSGRLGAGTQGFRSISRTLLINDNVKDRDRGRTAGSRFSSRMENDIPKAVFRAPMSASGHPSSEAGPLTISLPA